MQSVLTNSRPRIRQISTVAFLFGLLVALLLSQTPSPAQAAQNRYQASGHTSWATWWADHFPGRGSGDGGSGPDDSGSGSEDPGSGSVVWKADAESSMTSEWASSSSIPFASAPPNPDPSRIARDPFSAQGQSSYRFELRAGDDSYGARAELGQALPARAEFENRWFLPGDERWISMQYYLPSTWPDDNTWQVLMQIKPVTPGGGGGTMGVSTEADGLKFSGTTNEWGSTEGRIFDGEGPLPGKAYPFTRGQWLKLTWHIVFSADPAVGSLEVFGDLADGLGMRTLVPRRERATMKYHDGVMDPMHLRVGIYRDPTITKTASAYVDGITVATTREAAEANAFGG